MKDNRRLRRDMERRTFVCAVFAGLVAGVRGLGADAAQRKDPAEPLIEVMVSDHSSYKRVPNARVWVVSEAGKVLAETRTASNGMATLPVVSPKAHPQYIFVEAQGTFVTGRKWVPGAREYYMPAMGLRQLGFN